ncbi:NADP-dependent oxidoreductase [Nocardia vinacea]|uniref:NADP-dependent oxidoreductase n=1 Tax=Nocardia vinacea TaxID=96468 RepID=A0ABZ1YTG8_9NOCA|nr:NADP-dependent oxidoreductase [Nocardia vinacea]
MRNRQVVLRQRPVDRLDVSHFAVVDGAIGRPGEGEVLVRTVLLSIDPANRAWMQGRTYRDRLEDGQVMEGFVLGEVIDANGTDIAAGTIVECQGKWQEFAVLPRALVRPIEVLGPLEQHLGLLGINGVTAYFGLYRVGCVAAGETVVVSAAAGATGHLVGQLAKLRGARVVGIAGSEAKNAVLVEKLGFDAAVDHHRDDLLASLRAACPNGVDVYFDNVGGPVLDTALRVMNPHGRIVCCGVVSQYDTSSPAPGPRGVPGLLITKRLRMEGFLAPDFLDEWPEATRKLADLADSGEIVGLVTMTDGLESAPEALVGLLAGKNVGKAVVRVAPDPVRRSPEP